MTEPHDDPRDIERLTAALRVLLATYPDLAAPENRERFAAYIDRLQREEKACQAKDGCP